MKKLKVLFLCTGNSARSIFGEYILRKRDSLRFESYSAGSAPKDGPHPMALRILEEELHIDASAARSKSWSEFKDVAFDIVITVCDNARETCPVWPGQPIVAHWGSPDPAAFEGSEEDTYRFFRDVALQITRRVDLLTALPVSRLQRYSKLGVRSVMEIGEQEGFVSEGIGTQKR